ncbi:hypothetical protein ABTG43_19060, partial [Acinetobacter baumannii]
TEKSKEVVDGVVDLTPTPSLVQTIGGEVGQNDLDRDEAQGLPDGQGVEQGEQSPQSETTEPQVRRSTRERQPSTRYHAADYILL